MICRGAPTQEPCLWRQTSHQTLIQGFFAPDLWVAKPDLQAATMAAQQAPDAAAAAAAALTQDEATVYDRQLRVWGVEVQKK